MAEKSQSKLIIFNDAALRTKQAIVGDKFQLEKRLEPIHQSILSPETSTPFSVMFSGGWGTGKTSAMAWLSDYLVVEGKNRGPLKIDTCWFYPWKYQDREDVWKGLIAEVIVTSMQMDSVDAAKILKASKQFGKFLGGGFVRLLGGLKISAGAANSVEAEYELKDALNGIIEEYGKHVTPQDAYYNVFEHTLETWIESCYKPNERRLVIFIDDLDRCMPAIALQVLEAIKLYLNIPNVVVIVGVDREVIDAVVLKHYENCLGAASAELKQKSRQYLDKMFQIEVPISPRDYQVTTFIQDQLPKSQIWEQMSVEHQALIGAVIGEIADINPRSVIRALNTAIVGASVETGKLAIAQAMQEALVTSILQKLTDSECCDVRNLLKSEHREFFHAWSQSVTANPNLARNIPEKDFFEKKQNEPKDEARSETARETSTFDHLLKLSDDYPKYKELLCQRTLGQLMRIPFRPEPTTEAPALMPGNTVSGAIAPNWDKVRRFIAERSGRGFDEVTAQSLAEMQEIDFSDFEADDSCLACLGTLIGLKTLDLANTRVTDAGMKSLENLTTLTELRLWSTEVTDSGLKSLEKLTSLTTLSLGNTQVTDAGLKSLEKLTLLTSLSLSSTQVTDAGLNSMEKFTSLTELKLDHNRVTDAGLMSLEKLTSLTSLSLGNTQVSDAGLKSMEKLTALTVLRLWTTEVSDEGLKSLEKLSSLTTLSLGNTEVTDEGLKSLEKLTSLTTLSLGNTEVTSVGLKSLESLVSLTELFLYGTRVTDEGLKSLEKLTSLKHLDLDSTSITDKGLKGLQKLPSLDHLEVCHTAVTDVGLKSLEKLSSLKRLLLFNTRATAEGIDSLRSALPNCEIYY